MCFPFSWVYTFVGSDSNSMSNIMRDYQTTGQSYFKYVTVSALKQIGTLSDEHRLYSQTLSTESLGFASDPL